MARRGAVRTNYRSGKYAALHLLFCRWLRTYATPKEHCYVTLGGTELKDLESLSFIDPGLLRPCISYENRRDRMGYAEETCKTLMDKGIPARVERGDIFSYVRQEDKPHIYFFDFEGICAWADYSQRFDEMFRKEHIREGDLIVITSHLGHNPGWPKQGDCATLGKLAYLDNDDPLPC